MYLVGLGLVLLVLKFLEVGVMVKWEWWQTLIPFGLAVLWWSWSDWSGYTKKRINDQMRKKQNERRQQRIEELHPDRKRR